MARMDGKIQEWNKAELHLHLEGAVEPETLREIDPSIGLSPDQIRQRYCYHDFPGFLECYKWVTGYLNGPASYSLAARRLLESLQRQGVTYAEINLSVGVMTLRAQDVHGIVRAVRRECDEAGLPVGFIFDAVRHFGPVAARVVAELAVDLKDEGVVGFGVGGDELRGPVHWFAGCFEYARSHGLRIAPHAGETGGPDSIRAALDLGAGRIGHGIRAVEDRDLQRRLRDEGIPLEVCISSNLATGVVRSLEAHPLRKLFDAGVPIVLNTDDPAMFHTTLLKEYELAATAFGFSESELKLLAENSLRHAFQPTIRPVLPSERRPLGTRSTVPLLPVVPALLVPSASPALAQIAETNPRQPQTALTKQTHRQPRRSGTK